MEPKISVERPKQKRASQRQVMEAVSEYFNNTSISITDLAKKHGVQRGHLNTKIKEVRDKYENPKKNDFGHVIADPDIDKPELRELVADTKRQLFNGAKGLEQIRQIDSPIAQELYEDILDSLREINARTTRYITKLGVGILKDFSSKTDELRANGKMDLKNIKASMDILKTANDFLGIPKAQMQINIQNNQNNINGSNGSNLDSISFEIVSKTQEVVEGEIVETEDSKREQ